MKHKLIKFMIAAQDLEKLRAIYKLIANAQGTVAFDQDGQACTFCSNDYPIVRVNSWYYLVGNFVDCDNFTLMCVLAETTTAPVLSDVLVLTASGRDGEIYLTESEITADRHKHYACLVEITGRVHNSPNITELPDEIKQMFSTYFTVGFEGSFWRESSTVSVPSESYLAPLFKEMNVTSQVGKIYVAFLCYLLFYNNHTDEVRAHQDSYLNELFRDLCDTAIIKLAIISPPLIDSVARMIIEQEGFDFTTQRLCYEYVAPYLKEHALWDGLTL